MCVMHSCAFYSSIRIRVNLGAEHTSFFLSYEESRLCDFLKTVLTSSAFSICAYQMFSLKPLHTIGKVSLNASILYKNQEICNKTNSKNAFSIFVFIGNGRSASYFTNYSKTIAHQAEIFQGKLSTIVIFIPCKLCVSL